MQVFVTGGTGYIGSRLIPALIGRGHRVAALARRESAQRLASGCRVVIGDALDGSSYAPAIDGADALAIITEWQEFRSPDFDTIRDKLSNPVIFDGRNIYDPGLVKSFGLQYFGIGRNS